MTTGHVLLGLEWRGSMIKIGMMIGDRYEILEKIGTGGMSDVYTTTQQRGRIFIYH